MCGNQPCALPYLECKAKFLLECALADLEGIMPEFEPSGDRLHPGWRTVKELKEYLGEEEK